MQVSILMVRALVGMIERAGERRERFLSLAGIDPRSIEAGEARLPVVDYLRCIDAALAVSRDPALGLHLGERAHPAMFDVIGPLTEQAATLRASVEAMMRYSRLLAEGVSPELRETDAAAAAIRFPGLRGELAAVRFTAEFAMAGLVRTLQLFAGDRARPEEVRFGYQAPEYAAEYGRIFGGAERFGCKHTEILFPRAWLDRAQMYGSPDVHAALSEQAERKLVRLERQQPWSERAERVLAEHAAHPLTMAQVARELDISARSLRRRIQAEGTSFAELVVRVRTKTAMRLLERPDMSIQEAAYALGFASPAAFHRAFKRWTSMTPKQYRDTR